MPCSSSAWLGLRHLCVKQLLSAIQELEIELDDDDGPVVDSVQPQISATCKPDASAAVHDLTGAQLCHLNAYACVLPQLFVCDSAIISAR